VTKPPARKRTVGSLTQADFGKTVQVAGYPQGILWAVQHVAAFGDIPEAWTRLTIRAHRGSEGTRGLHPGTPVIVTTPPSGSGEGGPSENRERQQ
jgi:hypothetical protein